jgi:hypothetical protein
MIANRDGRETLDSAETFAYYRTLLEGRRRGLSRSFGARQRKTGVLLAKSLATYLKELSVKKIALTLVAVSVLGLAACNNASTEATNNAVANSMDAMNAATADMQNAADQVGAAAANATDAAANAADSAGAAAANVADAAAGAATNETK